MAKVLILVIILIYIQYCKSFTKTTNKYFNIKRYPLNTLKKSSVNNIVSEKSVFDFEGTKYKYDDRSIDPLFNKAKKNNISIGNYFFILSVVAFWSYKGVYAKDLYISPSNSIAHFDLNSLRGLCIWLLLFVSSAILHSAESAITRISPWKVKEFADVEGEKSPFTKLSNNLTKYLSTILLTTTAFSIYSTALFVTTFSSIFPKATLGSITIALTLVTLFLGELLPKALAVANSELVARKV